MAIKTFTAGSVLTAADTNTYLANSGLVYVKSQTVGSGVSSVTVTDAFSATYDAYKVVMTGGTQSVNSDIYLQLGGSNTAYYGTLVYLLVGSSIAVASADNTSTMPWIGGGAAGQASHATFELINPYLAQWTKIRYGAYQNDKNYGILNGEHRVATSYTSFTLGIVGGSLTGGTITVYGYRKA